MEEDSSQTSDLGREEPCSAVAAALEQELARLKAREDGEEYYETGAAASLEADSSETRAQSRRKLSTGGVQRPSLKGGRSSFELSLPGRRKLSLPGRRKLSGQGEPSSPKAKEAVLPPSPPEAAYDASTPPDQTDAAPPLTQRRVGVTVMHVHRV